MKKKEVLREILLKLEEIEGVLNDVAKNLIPQPKEGPELLNEFIPEEEVPSSRVLAEYDDTEETDRLITDQDGWSNK